MKEIAIREYVSNIDFKNDDWKLPKIKEDMRRFLGEEPGIDVIYKKDVMVNEVSGEAKEFVDVDKIQIIFTDTDDKFKKIEFILGEKI
jgi:threonine aldolase